jgi:hypothetical protein
MSFEPVRHRWDKFKTNTDLRNHFLPIGHAIRTGKLKLGRPHYALPLTLGVYEAVCCGYGQIAAVEMGVAGGDGLLALCEAAAFFRDTMDIDVRVYGFDNATGLPALQGHRDHPELWEKGQFLLPDAAALRQRLPDFAELHIGDIADTIDAFHATLANRPLAFCAIDVDLYSSTKSCFRMLEWEPTCYLPATPFYFDDTESFIVYNDWCGEELAMREYNEAHEKRKFQKNPAFDIRRFSVLHVLDHPVRTGAQSPIFPLRIVPMKSAPGAGKRAREK